MNGLHSTLEKKGGPNFSNIFNLIMMWTISSVINSTA